MSTYTHLLKGTLMNAAEFIVGFKIVFRKSKFDICFQRTLLGIPRA